MKIGIVGAGDVALHLAEGLVNCGHQVMIGTRKPDKKLLASWKKSSNKAKSIGTTTESANFGEIIILAIAWHASEDVLAQIRPEAAGKVVIDLTNPLNFDGQDVPQLSIGHITSAGEIVQQSLPDSHVVKTLNFINYAHMVQPKFKEGLPIMFVCGNNKSAKNSTNELLRELGWQDTLDIGGIEKSRLLEPLAILWIEYGVARKTWDHAFAMLVE